MFHRLFKDNRGESPLEVIFPVMVIIIVMSFLVFTFGGIVDQFSYTFSNMAISLNLPWSQGLFKMPMTMFRWFYIVPTFFVIIYFVWGIKAIIRKHKYTRQQQETFMEDGI